VVEFSVRYEWRCLLTLIERLLSNPSALIVVSKGMWAVEPAPTNLEHRKPNVGDRPWQILGAIRTVAIVWEGAESLCFLVTQITHDFTDFSSDKFYDIWTQQRQLVSPCKRSEQTFDNFIIRGRFCKKRKNCYQNFQVLLLQAVITPQWLQIVGNSLPNGPSTGCLVSIFTVRINSKSFSSDVCSAQERTPTPNFSRIPYRIVT